MLAISCWLFSGCKTYKPDSLPSKQLVFGSGGGMTGAVKEYILLENGQLFTRNSLTDKTEELSKVSKKEAKALYKEYEASIKELAHDEPGNLYYFLNMKSDSTKEHKLIWSGQGGAPDAAKTFYDALTKLVKKE